jgi:hypothetical protein
MQSKTQHDCNPRLDEFRGKAFGSNRAAADQFAALPIIELFGPSAKACEGSPST